MPGSMSTYARRSRFIPRTNAASSCEALVTRVCVSVPVSSTAAPRPSAKARNGPSAPDCLTTSASTTSTAEVDVNWAMIRLITSFQVWLRVASSDQCSVASICARTAGGTGSGIGWLMAAP